MKTTSIIGSGWVGENLGRGLIKLGSEVIFYDKSKDKLKELEGNGLNTTSSLKRAVKKSEISYLCVPTPTEGGEINLEYIKSATESLSNCLREKQDYHTVAVKSTVVPSTTEKLVIPLLEKGSGKKVGKDIGVCMNPEFMTEISGSWSEKEKYARKFFDTDRVVIGEYNKKSGDKLAELFEPLDAPIIRVNLRTAEMIKYVANCALASRISYWNEIYQICNRFDIDSDTVAQTVAMDPRIGEYGTVHGKAFGGKCLPKDLRAFINFAEKEIELKPDLLKAVEKINREMAEKYGVRE